MNWLLGRMIREVFQMMGMKKRRNNRSLMLIAGLGLGAAALSMMKGRNMNTVMDPITDAVGQMGIKNPLG
jgi:hypothetical protein